MQEGPQGLDAYEQMVDTFAEQAKMFWRMWGPAGEPMVRGIEAWRRCNARTSSGLGKPQERGDNPNTYCLYFRAAGRGLSYTGLRPLFLPRYSFNLHNTATKLPCKGLRGVG